jgi:hypothetical protein
METALWVAAQEVARQSGMEFSVPCAHNVRDFIRAGTLNMKRYSRESEDDFESAKKSLILLVESMVNSTRTNGEKPLAGKPFVVREAALVAAKRLCPLWPFC